MKKILCLLFLAIMLIFMPGTLKQSFAGGGPRKTTYYHEVYNHSAYTLKFTSANINLRGYYQDNPTNCKGVTLVPGQAISCHVKSDKDYRYAFFNLDAYNTNGEKCGSASIRFTHNKRTWVITRLGMYFE